MCVNLMQQNLVRRRKNFYCTQINKIDDNDDNFLQTIIVKTTKIALNTSINIIIAKFTDITTRTVLISAFKIITSKITDETKIESKFVTSIPKTAEFSSTNGNARTRFNQGNRRRNATSALVSAVNHIILETLNSTANSKYISL